MNPALQRQLDAVVDRQIDQLAYELHGLTEHEINIEEGDYKMIIKALNLLGSSPFLVEIQERLLCCFRQPLPPLDLPSSFFAGPLAAMHV
jgi:hypothetical protein